MKILFCNTIPSQCGVHQYGENLAAVMDGSGLFEILLCHPSSIDEMRQIHFEFEPDFTFYNWQQLIGGWMGGAPFDGLGKQILCYHDLDARFAAFDAILFSDPTMPQHDNWHPIGRPLNFIPITSQRPAYTRFTVGINGFIGAWSNEAVSYLVSTIGACHVRLHLPYSTFCDPHGTMACGIGFECLKLAQKNGTTVEVSHEFMDWSQLINWLYCNDLNLYVRNPGVGWRGVSSILDAAMCAQKPIAINRSPAFRHMHDCSPSICVEDRSLQAIHDSGIKPLQTKYHEYNPSVVSQKIKTILESI